MTNLKFYKQAMNFCPFWLEQNEFSTKLIDLLYCKQLLVCEDVTIDDWTLSRGGIMCKMRSVPVLSKYADMYESAKTLEEYKVLWDALAEELDSYVGNETEYEPSDEEMWWESFVASLKNMLMKTMDAAKTDYLFGMPVRTHLVRYLSVDDLDVVDNFTELFESLLNNTGYKERPKYSDTIIKWCRMHFVKDCEAEYSRVCKLFNCTDAGALDGYLLKNMDL